jgi:hypothetical protein
MHADWISVNSTLPNPPSHAADTAFTNANCPTTGTPNQRQQQLPILQTTFTTTYFPPSYDYYPGLQNVNPYDPQYLGIAPPPALSTGDRTPTAQSPQTPIARSLQTPTPESPQMSDFTLDSGDKMPAEESLQIRDDIDPCSPASSTTSEVSAWNYECFR